MMISISYIIPLIILKPFFKSCFYTYLNVHYVVSFIMMIYRLESVNTIKAISRQNYKVLHHEQRQEAQKKNQ